MSFDLARLEHLMATKATVAAHLAELLEEISCLHAGRQETTLAVSFHTPRGNAPGAPVWQVVCRRRSIGG
jgi:hypothetical protein